MARGKGFLMVSASPLTRSSYHAGDDFARLRARAAQRGRSPRPGAPGPMPTHAEKRVLPYHAGAAFDLVADVERYPEFLPWCVGARIRERDGRSIIADLVIGFKMFRERFTSRVTLDRPRGSTSPTSTARSATSTTTGVFEPMPDGGCLIDFYVDFEFRSRMLQKLIGMLFNEAVRRMVSAFETRAKQLYGDSTTAAEAAEPRRPVASRA